MGSDICTYCFDEFVLQVGERRLLRQGRIVALRPKAFDTLLCLVTRPGHLVRRAQLVADVWGGAHVSEEVLTHCVSEVRRALGESPRDPCYLETVPRFGYRFVADVRTFAASTVESRKPAASVPSIAVLPFANLSSDAENEYLCDGLSEELINRLTKIRGLRVIAHSSSFAFKGLEVDAREIGRRLHINRILEGSVRKSGDRLRISAQLIDTGDGSHLWCEQYDRPLEDVFDVQDEISRAILSGLEGPLIETGARAPAKPQTEDTVAYQLYLKGRFFWHQRFRGGLDQAIDSFRQAIARDPNFAAAYVGLSYCQASVGVWGFAHPESVFPDVAELAQRALEIDDSLAEAHAALAFVDTFYGWDWEGAARGFDRAVRLNPGSALVRLWLGHYLSIVGRMDEALAEMRLAQDLDPLSPIVSANLGWTFVLAHDTDQAIEELRRVLSLDSDNPLAHFYLGYAFAEAGLLDDAISSFEFARNVTGGMPWLSESIAWALALDGRPEMARGLVRDAERRGLSTYVPPSATAMLHLGLGEDDNALTWLERGVEEHDPLISWLGFMPCFDRLHAESRFQELLRTVGLPAASDRE
jgi:TolB-like protein/Flp pilus assembly protein TadD